MTLRHGARREAALLQDFAIVLGHRHAAAVSQITLCPLVAASAEDGLVRARPGRLQITAVVHLVHTA